MTGEGLTNEIVNRLHHETGYEFLPLRSKCDANQEAIESLSCVLDGGRSEATAAWEKVVATIRSNTDFRGSMVLMTIADAYDVEFAYKSYEAVIPFPLPRFSFIQPANGSYAPCVLRIEQPGQETRDELGRILLDHGFREQSTAASRVFSLAFQWFPDGRRAYDRMIDHISHSGGASRVNLAITCRCIKSSAGFEMPAVVAEAAFSNPGSSA